jgi:hypothetical protein
MCTVNSFWDIMILFWTPFFRTFCRSKFRTNRDQRNRRHFYDLYSADLNVSLCLGTSIPDRGLSWFSVSSGCAISLWVTAGDGYSNQPRCGYWRNKSAGNIALRSTNKQPSEHLLGKFVMYDNVDNNTCLTYLSSFPNISTVPHFQNICFLSLCHDFALNLIIHVYCRVSLHIGLFSGIEMILKLPSEE